MFGRVSVVPIPARSDADYGARLDLNSHFFLVIGSVVVNERLERKLMVRG